MAQQFREPLDPCIPEPLIPAEPIVGALERPRIDAAVVDPATHGAFDEPGLLERLDVLRGGRERHAMWCGELGNCLFTSGEPFQHRAPGGVAECPENAVEPVRLFNHTVEYICGNAFVNHLVEL